MYVVAAQRSFYYRVFFLEKVPWGKPEEVKKNEFDYGSDDGKSGWMAKTEGK